MGWLRLVGSLKSQVSFAKETYKRDYILQKRPIILKETNNRSHPIDVPSRKHKEQPQKKKSQQHNFSKVCPTVIISSKLVSISQAYGYFW